MNTWLENAAGAIEQKLSGLNLRAATLGFDPKDATDESKRLILEASVSLCALPSVLNIPHSLEEAFVQLASVQEAIAAMDNSAEDGSFDEGSHPSAPEVLLVGVVVVRHRCHLCHLGLIRRRQHHRLVLLVVERLVLLQLHMG